ncbi:CRISPR-associated protein Cas5 [Campylobacter concisus]
MSIVAFRLFGDYAHFSHPATIYSSLTYPVPPKTTIMGFLGAVIGEEEYFKLSNIQYSVKIDRQILKKSFVFNGIKFALSSNMHIEEGYQNAKEKKQFYRELICLPSYVVFLNLENLGQSYQDKIISNLKEHKTAFTPYLGINFCIADFSWIDIKICEKISQAESFINTFTLMNDFVFEGIDENAKLTTARMPCNCENGQILKILKTL